MTGQQVVFIKIDGQVRGITISVEVVGVIHHDGQINCVAGNAGRRQGGEVFNHQVAVGKGGTNIHNIGDVLGIDNNSTVIESGIYIHRFKQNVLYMLNARLNICLIITGNTVEFRHQLSVQGVLITCTTVNAVSSGKAVGNATSPGILGQGCIKKVVSCGTSEIVGIGGEHEGGGGFAGTYFDISCTGVGHGGINLGIPGGCSSAIGGVAGQIGIGGEQVNKGSPFCAGSSGQCSCDNILGVGHVLGGQAEFTLNDTNVRDNYSGNVSSGHGAEAPAVVTIKYCVGATQCGDVTENTLHGDGADLYVVQGVGELLYSEPVLIGQCW